MTPGYTALDHFLSAVLPYRPEGTLISTFTAYLDDGGHPDDQPVVLVAGYVSTEEQWELFRDEWRGFLAREGVDSLVLHMTDFESGKVEPFSNWSPSKKHDFLEAAAFWVNLRTRKSFSVVVPMADYLSINEEYFLEECWGAPYSLAGRTIAESLTQWQEEHNATDTPLLTIFEDGTKHKGDLLEQFRRDELRTPRFAKKGEVPALQPADWLAWELFNAYKLKDSSRPSFRALRVKGTEFHKHWTKEALINLCKVEDIPLRSSGAQTVLFHSEPKRPRRRTVRRDIRPSDISGEDRNEF